MLTFGSGGTAALQGYWHTVPRPGEERGRTLSSAQKGQRLKGTRAQGQKGTRAQGHKEED